MVNTPTQVHVVDDEQWATMTEHARTNMRRKGWPSNVLMLSLDGMSFLGMDEKGHLYLDGARLYTERRLGRQERVLGWFLAIFAGVGAIAAVASAIADWKAL